MCITLQEREANRIEDRGKGAAQNCLPRSGHSLGPEVVGSQLGIVNLQDQPGIVSLGQQDLGNQGHPVSWGRPSSGGGRWEGTAQLSEAILLSTFGISSPELRA